MKTLEELKRAINYPQTDENFISYASLLQEKQIITINPGDIESSSEGYTLSNAFYMKMAEVYGVQLDGELNPIKQEGEL